MEPISGIPGSVGGACYMNAGAYGACMADVLESVRVYKPARQLDDGTRGSGNIIEFDVDELNLGYQMCIRDRPTVVSWLAKLNVVPVTKLQTATRTIRRLTRRTGLPTSRIKSAINIAVTAPIKRADCELARTRMPIKLHKSAVPNRYIAPLTPLSGGLSDRITKHLQLAFGNKKRRPDVYKRQV